MVNYLRWKKLNEIYRTPIRQRKFAVADDELMNILEESDAESELTESGEDRGEVSEEEEGDQKPLLGEWSPSSVQDPLKEPLDRGGFEGRSNAMLLKQEIFDYSDPGWLEQHL